MQVLQPYIVRLVPYLQKFQEQLASLNQSYYFEPSIAIITLLTFFLLGRKTYESKFSYILNTINDAQQAKNKLNEQSKKINESLAFLKSKLRFLQITTVFIVGAVGMTTYLTRINALLILTSIGGVLFVWILVWLRSKYLNFVKGRVEIKIQMKSLSADAEVKEIMNLLGQQISQSLKNKFQRDIDYQWRVEQNKQCDLARCYEEKKIYRQLYQLYQTIVAEMKKISWCDTCSKQLNIDSNEIKLFEIENRMKNYKNAIEETRLSLDRKKQLTNLLLRQWESLEAKLPNICKRGCCIRVRTTLDDIKRRNHERLKELKQRLGRLGQK